MKRRKVKKSKSQNKGWVRVAGKTPVMELYVLLHQGWTPEQEAAFREEPNQMTTEEVQPMELRACGEERYLMLHTADGAPLLIGVSEVRRVMPVSIGEDPTATLTRLQTQDLGTSILIKESTEQVAAMLSAVTEVIRCPS